MTIHQSEIQRQNTEYQAIRERILNPKVTVKRSDLEAASAHIAALQAKISELKESLAKSEGRIRSLELDVADRNARIIAQADMLATMDEQGIFSARKRPVAAIVSEVLRDFPDVTWGEIVGVRRTRHLIKPRQLCMAAVRDQRPDLSFPAIGKIFGNRDHTTVMHAVNKIKAQREKEKA